MVSIPIKLLNPSAKFAQRRTSTVTFRIEMTSTKTKLGKATAKYVPVGEQLPEAAAVSLTAHALPVLIETKIINAQTVRSECNVSGTALMILHVTALKAAQPPRWEIATTVPWAPAPKTNSSF